MVWLEACDVIQPPFWYSFTSFTISLIFALKVNKYKLYIANLRCMIELNAAVFSLFNFRWKTRVFSFKNEMT